MKYLKYLTILLCTLFMTSCVDWQKKYDKDLAEAAQPIKEKHEFVKAKYREACANHHCRIYNSMADLPNDTLTNVFFDILFWENDDYPSEQQPPLPDVLFVFSDKTETETDALSRSYAGASQRKVIRRHDYKNYMNEFQGDVLQKYQDARYLVVVSDSILVKPDFVKDKEFITGSYLDKVTIYDLNTFEKKKEFMVLSRNTQHIMVNEEYSILDNLAKWRKLFIKAKVRKEIL